MAEETKDHVIYCPTCGKQMVCIFLSHGVHQVTYTYTCDHHASAKLTVGYSYDYPMSRDVDVKPGAISGSQINEEHIRQVRKSHREVYKELAERWCRLVFPGLNFDHIQWNDVVDENHIVYVGKTKHVILDNGAVVPIEPIEGGDNDN